VIVAARNEELHLEGALGSLLHLDYPTCEVIVVDDRSTDGTSAILGRLRSQYPALRTLRVDVLPQGWLGKCHALAQGARTATGDYLLFTDADIVFDPTTLRRAMAYVREKGLDHLALIPRVQMPGSLLRAMGATFGLLFTSYSRPWKASDPKSRAHIGIGAFNLVRSETYRNAGGHEAVRRCPVDDVKLGERVKRSGGRQAAVIGVGLVSVEWYRTLGGLIQGLEKNSFAAVNYRLSSVALLTLAILALSVGPVALAFFTRGWPGWALNGASEILLLAMYCDQAKLQKIPAWTLVLFPLSLGIMLWILWRAALKTLFRGGIEWRGTFYPLGVLREEQD
jgi:glycosyltransferase involved in cell wall biosynthesis